MENEFVAKSFQNIDDDVLLQLFLVTSMATEGQLVYFKFDLGHVYP